MKKEKKKELNRLVYVLTFIFIQTIIFLIFRLPFYLPFLIFLIFFSGFYLLVLRNFKGRALTLLAIVWVFLSVPLFFSLFYLNRQNFMAQKILFAFLFFLCYFSTLAFLAWLYGLDGK